MKKDGDNMTKRTVCGVILCAFILGVVFFAGSYGYEKLVKRNKSYNIRYRTEEEFLQNIGSLGLGVTPADFNGVDIEGFMDYVERYEESGGILPIPILLANFKFDSLYPDHKLLTKREFYALLSSAAPRDVEYSGVSADVFDSVDFDDFMCYVYHVRRCFIDRHNFDLYLVRDELANYKKWLVLRSGKDYSYLLAGNKTSFNEEDISEITSIFMETIMMDGPCGMGVQVNYLLDFEENTLTVPSDGENYAPRGLYTLGSVHPARLPDNAIKTIGEFLVARDIMTPGKKNFSGTRWFTLCIGFKDGSVVRYPVEKTPPQIYLFINDLYGYINGIKRIKNCWGCELCPVLNPDGTAR